jgi:hypothetical protein
MVKRERTRRVERDSFEQGNRLTDQVHLISHAAIMRDDRVESLADRPGDQRTDLPIDLDGFIFFCFLPQGSQ